MKRPASERTARLFADQHVQIPLPLGFLAEPPPKPRKDYSLLKPCPCGFSSWDAAPGRSEPFCMNCRCWYGWWDREGGAERKLMLAKPALTVPPKQPSTVSAGELDAVVEFTMAMRLTNPLNGSQGRSRGWQIGRSVKRKKQRAQAKLNTECAFQCQDGIRKHPSHVTSGHAVMVTLTRIAYGKFDDDNLRAAFKSVRDGVADSLGFKDDSDPRLDWRYAQEPGRRLNRKKGLLAQHEIRVRIEIVT